METSNIINTTKKTRKKPCPRGTQYNKKTQQCEPNKKGDINESITKKKSSTPKKTGKQTRKKRCPNGTYYDKKTEQCEPKKNTEIPEPIEPQTEPIEPQPEPIEPQTEPIEPQTEPIEPQTEPIEPQTEPIEPINEEDEPIFKQNKKKTERELEERKELTENQTDYDFLYPNLNDPQFNIKISERKEFNDNKYDGEIHTDIEGHAEAMCNSDFELSPHQLFVRNFLSFQTPYNSLLLYHGLGSGKTCSAISVAEEMRDYIMQMGITSKIMIVASPNVQTNFKLQLFDESKLKLIDGLWNIRACIGNKFLKEINPMNMKGLTKENVIKQINRLIDTYYYFSGYVEFANYIHRKSAITDTTITDPKKLQKIIKHNLTKVFNNRLIIIDEIHNIRVSDDNKNKHIADKLLLLVKSVSTLRLLLLSATPMFNSYKEIIWLVNLMNINDRRATIEVKDVFNKDGTFKDITPGKESGKELLERKATGYISFVRGENPYTFPYRIWPNDFSPEHTFINKTYPTLQLNGTSELLPENAIKHLSLYLVDIGEYQERGYNYIIKRIKTGHIGNIQMPNIENIETFGYTMLQQPLEGLNIIFPDERLDNESPTFNSVELVGINGLKRIMSFKEDQNTHIRSNFDYISSVIEKYGRIFSPNEIGKYSNKIKTICDRIINSTGVILVYSQYIDAGLVPLALALEELGFSRAGSVNSLFKTPPVNKKSGFNYVMITGDKGFSPNPERDIKMATSDENINGKNVKVVLISQTGTEGLDLKFIRQVHILEPWYNMNRIEQIIGRAVRTCSHKALPFNERNVEIYLYASIMGKNETEETADLYVYRLAEIKANLIGNVSRSLKEISVDCILNNGQTNFSEEFMEQNNVKPVNLKLSSGKLLENYKIGDKPYSSICDYMESCSFKCRPTKEITSNQVRMDTYNEDFIMMNNDKLVYKIKQLMKDKFYYRKKELVTLLNTLKPYPLVQINAALHQLIEENEFITDKYGRTGKFINIDDLYLFQPIEIKDNQIGMYDRTTPLELKHDKFVIKLPKDIQVNEAIINVKDKENDKERDKKQLYIKTNANAAADADAAVDFAADADVVNANSDASGVDNYNSSENDVRMIIKHINSKYEIATTNQILLKGEKNWYMHCKLAIDLLIKYGFNESLLKSFIVEHIVDELPINIIITILNELYETTNYDKIESINYVKSYIETQILRGDKNIKGFLWKDKKKQVIIVKHSDDNWHIAEAEDIKDLTQVVINKKQNIISNLNNLIGFINNFKNEDYVVFKVKNVTNQRDAGARCDQISIKGKSIDTLNTIIGSKQFDSKTLNIPQREICIIQEFYLRKFDKDRKDKKRWFLSPPEAVLTDIEKYSSAKKIKKIYKNKIE